MENSAVFLAATGASLQGEENFVSHLRWGAGREMVVCPLLFVFDAMLLPVFAMGLGV
jgi:hypothetical protein